MKFAVLHKAQSELVSLTDPHRWVRERVRVDSWPVLALSPCAEEVRPSIILLAVRGNALRPLGVPPAFLQ